MIGLSELVIGIVGIRNVHKKTVVACVRTPEKGRGKLRGCLSSVSRPYILGTDDSQPIADHNPPGHRHAM